MRPPDPGVVVTLVRDAKDAHDPLESIKSTNRVRNVLLRERALREGAFEALLCTRDGDVCEGTLSNLWAVVDGVVCTPATERGCLAGVMRGLILEGLAASGIAHAQVRLEPRSARARARSSSRTRPGARCRWSRCAASCAACRAPRARCCGAFAPRSASARRLARGLAALEPVPSAADKTPKPTRSARSCPGAWRLR